MDPHASPADLFQRGIDQFNSKHFFDAHESWEAIWLAAAEPDKTFLQGIIQIAAAFHHYGRGNRAGAESLLRAGLQKITRFPYNYRGLRVDSLKAAAEKWLKALETGQSPTQEEFPTITYS
ncbi:MAG: DUF309 domain-containing protein [Acidobacteria bacterium]|nr:DUF309 domain-containing protein [Acidobacteriota bacterium]